MREESPSWPIQHLIVLPREDIVWCPVFKAASSSWLNNLLALSYLPREEQERTRERNPKAPLKLVKPISRPIPTASSYQADLYLLHTRYCHKKAMKKSSVLKSTI